MLTTTRERPILFSGPMVRAILDGRKTQTRRLIKPQPQADHLSLMPVSCDLCGIMPDGTPVGTRPAPKRGWMCCPYGKIGDRLWVREAWRIDTDGTRQWLAYVAEEAIRDIPPEHADKYGHREAVRYGDPVHGIWNRPSIHMPRWASRLTLEIVSVRVQRVQEINEEDAMSEGVDADTRSCSPLVRRATMRFLFGHLWNTVNGPGAWARNDWVWAVEFKVVKP